MNRKRAREILYLFLMEDIANNRNHFEDTHAITYFGNHFAVLEYATGNVETFMVKLVPSTLPQEQWAEEFAAQGWEEYMEEKVDED